MCFWNMRGMDACDSNMVAVRRDVCYLPASLAAPPLNSLPMSQKPARAEYKPLGKELWRASRQRAPSDTRVITTGAI